MPTATEEQRMAVLMPIKDDYNLYFGKMTFKNEKEDQFTAWQNLLMLAHEYPNKFYIKILKFLVEKIRQIEVTSKISLLR